MDKFLKIALALTAIDQMSGVVGAAVGKSLSEIKKFKEGAKSIRDGFALIEGGKKGFEMLKDVKDDFADMQDAALYLRAAMMKDGGIVDEKMYQKVFRLTEKLSDKYTGSTRDYLEMATVMKQNSLDLQDVLNGVGEGAAKLSVLFKMKPASTAEFAARMRNDMGVAVKDMDKVYDLVARVYNVGVGKTGEEAVTQMKEYFAKVGLGLANLKTEGYESARAMAAVGAIFMRRGISGESVGTNFRRILDGLRSGDKVKKAQAEAHKLGMTLEFFDKNHKFISVENFIGQIAKLQSLNPTQIEKVLKPFAGKQGLSTDFLEFIAGHGLKDFNEMNKHLFTQGTVAQKTATVMGGLRSQSERLRTTFTNLKASIGAGLQPSLDKILPVMNAIVSSMRNFFEGHPKLTQFIVTFVALASAGMLFLGVIKVVRGLIMVMRLLNIVSMANPFMLIAVIAVAAIALIITYWDEIVGFFKFLWEKVKGFFVAAWGFIKKVFVDYNPAVLVYRNWGKITSWFHDLWERVKVVFSSVFGWLKKIFFDNSPVVLIYTHWGQITAWFKALWEKVKVIFSALIDWLMGLGPRMFKAGENMIKSVWEGMKKWVHKPVEAIKGMVQKIRNMLPFSPAKEGPLRDIHRIRLVETIAEGIRPEALIQKMRTVTQAIVNFSPVGISPTTNLAGSSAPYQITFAPVYHAAPGEDISKGKSAFMDEMKKWSKQVADMVNKENNFNQRKTY